MPHTKLLWRLLALVVCLSAWPAWAQDAAGAWSALVYSTAEQSLVRVGMDGELARYELEPGPNVALQGRHIVVWPDGNRVAYCAVSFGSATGATLYVRDLAAGEVLAETPFEDAADCRVTQASLSDDGSRLAVALFNYFPGQTNADTTLPPWQLVVVDAETGEVTHRLDAAEVVAETNIEAEQAIIPETRSFSGDTLEFFAIPYAVGGWDSYDVYAWNLDSGALTPVAGPGVYDVAALPETGERAYPAQDEALPFAMPDGPVPPNNIVLYENGEQAAEPIYHIATWVIIDTEFIENGQRLAIVQVPAVDQPQTTAFTVNMRAVALDRQGRTADLVSSDGSLALRDAPGGYVALLGPRDVDGAYRLLYGSDGQLTPLWQASGNSWELVWSAPAPVLPKLPPFSGWPVSAS